jgi:hypothetical protein
MIKDYDEVEDMTYDDDEDQEIGFLDLEEVLKGMDKVTISLGGKSE